MEIIPRHQIESKILLLRGRKVMMDKDLAMLYSVETKALNRAVKRNIDRFPEDFMFRLTREEFDHLRCQNGTSNWGGHRYPPHAFTENGVAMLSSVLNSKRAVQVNIQIMRAFTRIREMLSTHEELRQKIEEMEKKYNGQFRIVFDAIREMMVPPARPRRKIGFQGKGGPG